ncbi:MAG: hypothetical protein ACYC9L_12550 [Sulfuricaulis sp.]
MSVIEFLERIELPFQIGGIPAQNLVEILAPDGSDQTFGKGVRDRSVWYRFDFLDAEEPEVGSPSVKRKQWIIDEPLPKDRSGGNVALIRVAPH